MSEKEYFIKKAIGFTLFFLIILFLINSVFNFVMDNYYFVGEKHKYFDELVNQKQLNLLFLGDSHTEVSINPELIDNNSFNYAFSGEGGYIEAYYRLKRLIIEEKIIPKYVVLEVDYSFRETNSAIESFERDLYFARKDFSFNDFLNYGKISLETIISYYWGFIGRGKLILLPFYSEDRQINSLGYTFNDLNYHSPKVLNDKKIKEFEKDFEFNYLNKILNLIKENNINLIIIRYPLTPENRYYEIKSLEQYNKEVQKNIEFELQEYDYVFLDYMEVFDDDFYFADKTHLNNFGAKEFSKKLRQDLIELNILKK